MRRPGLNSPCGSRTRPAELDELCKFREAYGFPTIPEEIQLGVAPGHLLALDDDKDENQQNVTRLLTIMMAGYIEGRLATKSGQFVVAVGDGILEFYCRDKSISGKLRSLLREFKLKTFVCDHR